MPPDYSSDFKELVRTRTDLASLVGESISLTPRRGGREYVGLCPFHDDHNPSLIIYPERQSFRCWVCDEGGDCFSWVMKAENMEFRESLEMLARRANLEVPNTHRSQEVVPNEKNALYDVLKWAESEFHRCLLQSGRATPARDYLQNNRGFSHDTIARFYIGYHPDDWHWLKNRARNRFTPQQLFAVRLIGERDKNAGFYDFFVNRVLFPIHDEHGRTVAFGGRVLPHNTSADAPKYWNSPESAVFTKSRILYGLNAARAEIRRSQTVIVVEGYTDCITAHQYQISNVVGTLGTSLTETQVLGLKRFARKVVLVFDGDAAGHSAAERSLAKFLAQDVDLRILTLPSGTDPAAFLAEHGADAFRKLIDEAVEAWEYKFRLTIDRFGTESIDGRQRVLDAMLDLVVEAPRLSGTIREGIILGKLSQRLSLTEQVIRQQLGETRRKKFGRPAIRLSKTTRMEPTHTDQENNLIKRDQKHRDWVENEILEIVFAKPETIGTIRLQVSIEDFRNSHLRQLLEICYQLQDQGIAPSYERVMAELEDIDLRSLAARINEHSREKQTTRKLHGEKKQHDRATKNREKTFLDQAIESLRWRREEQLHDQTKGQLAQRPESSTGLDLEAKALLRQATEYHQKRVTKKTLT